MFSGLGGRVFGLYRHFMFESYDPDLIPDEIPWEEWDGYDD